MIVLCANTRKWQYQGKAFEDECNLEKGHEPHTRWHHSRFGLEWSPGNDRYRNRTRAAQAHLAENRLEEERVARVQTTMRVLREKADLTQTDLAALIKRQQPEVSMWEWGKERMPDHIRHQVFGILVAELADTYSLVHAIKPEDLDRAWDDVLKEI